ncbi:amino acid adenylation domain-containing protein [Streptacidiphilus sp. 4-A2]|nr:amino acid adenylation domain-containing protein [Streptacidiphilus sp. 4-A2]
MQQLANALPDTQVWHVYGPTEPPPSPVAIGHSGHPVGPPPIGRPLAGMRLRVLDAGPAAGSARVTGELYISGRVRPGIQRRPAATATRLWGPVRPTAAGCTHRRPGPLERRRAGGTSRADSHQAARLPDRTGRGGRGVGCPSGGR